jgi:hypothetical protein
MYFVGVLCEVTLYSLSSFERDSTRLYCTMKTVRLAIERQQSRSHVFVGDETDAKLKVVVKCLLYCPLFSFFDNNNITILK